MLNSLATYFWGSNTESEQDYTSNDSFERQLAIGEHLEIQQEDDWVVVKTAGDVTNDQQEETENMQAGEQQAMNSHVPNEESQPLSETSIQQRRNISVHATAHPGLVSAQQHIKNIHLAQRLQHSNDQKLISRSKCDRQNKVRENHGYGKGNNRRCKRMRPSGFISSRFNQRI